MKDRAIARNSFKEAEGDDRLRLGNSTIELSAPMRALPVEVQATTKARQFK